MRRPHWPPTRCRAIRRRRIRGSTSSRRTTPTDPTIDIDERHRRNRTATGDASLRGNVRIRMGQRLLTADEAEINATERSVSMRRQRRVPRPDAARARRGRHRSPAKATAEFQGAEFELLDRSVRGAAGDVRMRQQGLLELKDVPYTACPPGNEDWQLQRGRDRRSTSGRRSAPVATCGSISRACRSLYTPWISFPVGDQRKTGVLFPVDRQQRQSGTMLAVPYYWNLAPNRDATLMTRYYSVARSAPRSGVPLPHRIAAAAMLNAEYLFHDDERGRRLAQPRRAGGTSTRFKPRTRLLIDAAERQRPELFRGLRRRVRGHQRHVPQPQRRAAARHATTGRLIGRAQDYQVIDR